MIKNKMHPNTQGDEVPVKVTDTATGETIATFPSQKKAGRELLISISLISKRLKAQSTSKELKPVFSRRLNKSVYVEKV